MQLKEDILQIREGLKAGRYPNEASISRGIVMRILQSLGWDIFEPQLVWPEYSLSGRRVDYALCHPRRKPIVFIEVKQPGQSEGADKQLFQYAFDEGIPMAVLTDGKEWHFYLPGEQGRYDERRVYKLDLIEREVEECEYRFRRYLEYSAIGSGRALEEARKDYQSLTRVRQIKQTMPMAWAKLIDEPDEFLVELLADKVESLCGYKPGPDDVVAFFKEKNNMHTETVKEPISIASVVIKNKTEATPKPQPNGRLGFYINGHYFPATRPYARHVMTDFFEELARKDPTFMQKFASREHGKKRRYIARSPKELYPGNPNLEQHSYKLSNGWWIGVNYSRASIKNIIGLACEVAGLNYGTDVKAILE
jgi:predicted type IV restriction endonuclease